MGIAQIKDAFNAAADGKATVTRCLMTYERQHDVEMQVLHFQGAFADGSALDFKRSCRPHSNLVTEAMAAATELQAPKQKDPTP